MRSSASLTHALHSAADVAIRKLFPEQPLFVSAVTYAEVLTGARRGHHDEGHVKGFFSKLVSAVLPVDAPIAEKAAELRANSKSLRMPDALILATAESKTEVELIVTGDARAAKVSGLRIQVELLT